MARGVDAQVAQQVGEHEAAFGVGIADAHAAAGVAGDDPVADEGVGADAVAHHAEFGDQAHAAQPQAARGENRPAIARRPLSRLMPAMWPSVFRSAPPVSSW